MGTGDSRQYLMEGDPNISTCLHVPQDFFIFPPVSRKCETEPPGCICVNDCSEGFKFLLPVFLPHFRSASQPRKVANFSWKIRIIFLNPHRETSNKVSEAELGVYFGKIGFFGMLDWELQVNVN